ncbi:hypothetical protein TcWFU_008894 [Taenia crassiceps]|uniref:Uncharacterized protein n=1 Tax=Taenia crassiceps TaxID=6207 RepID=A0ABR4QTE1_9CEST
MLHEENIGDYTPPLPTMVETLKSIRVLSQNTASEQLATQYHSKDSRMLFFVDQTVLLHDAADPVSIFLNYGLHYLRVLPMKNWLTEGHDCCELKMSVYPASTSSGLILSSLADECGFAPWKYGQKFLPYRRRAYLYVVTASNTFCFGNNGVRPTV